MGMERQRRMEQRIDGLIDNKYRGKNIMNFQKMGEEIKYTNITIRTFFFFLFLSRPGKYVKSNNGSDYTFSC